MPLHVKSISISIAVISFFLISFVGWFVGLDPFVCCKRAFVGALMAYVAAAIVVKIINSILVSALVKYQIEQQTGMNEHGN